MEAGRLNGRRIVVPHSQRGVVLLIALIILVAMTLAGIGMMRSVDTGTLITGNLAFKQSTMNASDAGTSEGFNALATVANSSNPQDKAILQFDHGQPCANAPLATVAGCNLGVGNINLPGYSSTPKTINGIGGPCEVDHTCPQQTDYTWWTSDAYWTSANAPTITVPDPNGGPNPIARVSYLIHRMCQTQGSPNAAGQLCQTSTRQISGAEGRSLTSIVPTGLAITTNVFYRITTRSVGARNTVTYTQTLVLVP